jgi:hypothetical protein
VLVTYSAPVLYYESSLTIASRIQLLVQEAFLLKVSNHLTGHVRRWGAYTVSFLDLNLQETQGKQLYCICTPQINNSNLMPTWFRPNNRMNNFLIFVGYNWMLLGHLIVKKNHLYAFKLYWGVGTIITLTTTNICYTQVSYNANKLPSPLHLLHSSFPNPIIQSLPFQ